MAANKSGSGQSYLKRKEHRCGPDCFPTASVTFFCFACGEEIFRAQVARHGRRQPKPGEWETWYLCRDCHKARIKAHEEATADDSDKPEWDNWIKTGTGPIKMGPQGVPSDKTLKSRKAKGRFLK